MKSSQSSVPVGDVLRLIHEGIASETGEAFFAALVSATARAMRTRSAFVSDFAASPERARTIAFWNCDGFGENFEYDLDGTVCKGVLQGSIRYYPSGVAKEFPRERTREALARSEGRLASILRTAIVTIDAQHRIVRFNSAAGQIFRCAPDWAIGQPFDRFLSRRFRYVIRHYVDDVQRQGEQAWAPDGVTALRADGDEFPIEVALSPLEEEDGRLYTLSTGRKLGRSYQQIDRHSMEQLTGYPWPGNVRELQNVIDRAAILATGPTVQVRDMVFSQPPQLAAETSDGTTLDAVQKVHVTEVLDHCNWQVEGGRGASAALGLKRSTLRYRMQKLGIENSHITETRLTCSRPPTCGRINSWNHHRSRPPGPRRLAAALSRGLKNQPAQNGLSVSYGTENTLAQMLRQH